MKHAIWPLFGVTLLFVTTASLARNELQQLSDQQTRAITQACERTVNEYVFARDDGDAKRASKLFTENAVMRIFDREIKGRDAILIAMQQRAEQATWAHIVGGVLITLTSAHTARGESYALVFQAENATAAAADAVRGVVKYHDEFAVSELGCQIHSRRVEFRIGQ